MKKIAIILLVACMLLSSFAPVMASTNPAVYVTVNGKVLKFDVPPTVVNGRTLVPMRAIFEALDVSVEYDSVKKVVTGRKGDTVIILPLESRVATKNQQTITLDVPAMVIQGRTLVPVRFIAESLGAKVDWDSKTSTVIINSAGNSTSNSGTTTNQTTKNKLTTSQIAEKSNAVVTIVTDPGTSYEGFGSGFFISKDGKIVTNYHVIEEVENLQVIFENNVAYKGEIKILGFDREKDIAVLKITGDNYPFLPMGDSKLEKIGNDVVAIGTPRGLQNTVSTGIISGLRSGLIQTTAPISPGSSGGPLLNYYGEVIGINTAIYSNGANIGFAVSINEIKTLNMSQNLTLKQFVQLEKEYYAQNKVSYDEYVDYLYDYYSYFSLGNYRYVVDFFDIQIIENPNNSNHLALYYTVDSQNLIPLIQAFHNGHEAGIRELFLEVVVDLEMYYEKDVTAFIIYYADDWTIYPDAFVENALTNRSTVKYDSATGKWIVEFPVFMINSQYGADGYHYQWYK